MKATTPLNRKIICLGIDGMDPRFTKWMLDHGKMPNTAKMLEKGAAREDLVMLGGIPTVTPPMWTTLVTGAYPNTHGITGFYRASDDGLEYLEYNLDSRKCLAEPLWNVTAEAGMKTLVWHWPGSSWPPTSDSENLHVVDGTSPGAVGMSTSQVEGEFLFGATAEFSEPRVIKPAATDAVPPCVVTDLKLDGELSSSAEHIVDLEDVAARSNGSFVDIATTWSSGQGGSASIPMTRVISPLKPADQSKWQVDVNDAMEFVVLFSKGTLRRYGLLLKGADGKYDHVATYKNRKEETPITVINNGEFKHEIVDEAIKDDERKIVNRNARVLEIDPAGKLLRMWWSAAMDTQKDDVWHPKRLFKTVTENIGYIPPTTMNGMQNKELITDIMLANWDDSVEWQTGALNYLIDNEDYDIVFSHFHNVDLQSHMTTRYMTDQPGKEGHEGPYMAEGEHLTPAENHKFMEDIYEQTDRYIGGFLHYIDEGWTIFVFSDHDQLSPKHGYRLMGDIEEVNVRIMQALGLTALQIDENGEELRAIDWTKTYAIAQRENSIYLNIKGRDKHTLPDGTVIDGLIDPEDQYEWEEEIMTRLYGYKDPVTGKRVIGLALRNREAAILGLSGPLVGDIIYTMAEGYNWDHGESLSTSIGEGDTSVSPIFFAAGPGIRHGITERVIREVDLVPTVAAVAGVRMPAQCEGAPVYQIIED
mgnify:CR=1 FL=1